MAKNIVVRFLGDDDSLSKAYNRAINDGDSFANHTKRVAKGVATGLGIIGAAAGKMAWEGVQAYSDFNEAGSKVDQVFGEAAKDIRSFADDAGISLGLSKTAALDALGGFGNLFDQLKIGSQRSKEMSTGMVKLAADFASFHNADITEVLNAQASAFRGEYDALQRFLPLINAASVEQKAMEMTGKGNASAITEQEKALAVYQLMLDGAGKAQGDFARTSDGMANQTRQVKAEIDNAKVAIGNVLQNEFLPGLIDGLGLAGTKGDTLAEKIKKISDKVVEAGPEIRAIAKDVGEFVVQVTEAAKALNKFLDRLSKIGPGGGKRGSKGDDLLFDELFGMINGRASGGPVSARTPYVVGEQGPELFVPRGNGTIVPNGAGMGHTTVINNNFYVGGSVLAERELLDLVESGLAARAVRGS